MMTTPQFSMAVFLAQVKKIRDEFSLTQKAFTRRIDKKGDIISRWKSGEIAKVEINTRFKICAEFHKSLDWLLTGQESQTPPPLQPIITMVGEYPRLAAAVRVENYLAVPLVEAGVAARYPGTIPASYIQGLVWMHAAELGERRQRNLRAVWLGPEAQAMRRLLRTNDIIIVDPSAKPPDQPIDFKGTYLVRLNDEGDCGVRRLRETSEAWYFYADNPEYDLLQVMKSAEDNPIIGQVIYVWKCMPFNSESPHRK